MSSQHTVPKPIANLEAITAADDGVSAVPSAAPKGDVSGNDSELPIGRAFLVAKQLLGCLGFWQG